MNLVIVVEILAAILVLAATVRFAVRDIRRRSGASLHQPSGPEDIHEAPELEAEQHGHEVADQRDGEEDAALSASSTGLEQPTDMR